MSAPARELSSPRPFAVPRGASEPGTPELRRVGSGVARGLAVRSFGSGPPLLWLHGFTGSGASWLETARQLGPRRHLWVDLPGHGAAHAPREARAYAFDRVVDGLAGVLDACHVEAADVVGYSLGARLALALALRHPGRVRRAVLVGARAGLAHPAERAARCEADRALAARIETRGVPWFVSFWEGLPLFASQTRLPPELRARMRRTRLSHTAAGLAGALRGLGPGAQPPLFAELPGLRSPVLLVAGEEDPRFVAAARDLRARLPRARLAVLPRAGHAAHLENPDAFVRATRAFLAARLPHSPPRPARGLFRRTA